MDSKTASRSAAKTMQERSDEDLKGDVSLKGKGLHTGVDVNITFKPAPVGHGFKFCRVDLPEKPIIRAIADNVNDTSRGTTLKENGATVATIEHVLASFHGMNLDNILVEIDGPEAPIMGGSSAMFIDGINKVGIVDQDAGVRFVDQLSVY